MGKTHVISETMDVGKIVGPGSTRIVLDDGASDEIYCVERDNGRIPDLFSMNRSFDV